MPPALPPDCRPPVSSWPFRRGTVNNPVCYLDLGEVFTTEGIEETDIKNPTSSVRQPRHLEIKRLIYEGRLPSRCNETLERKRKQVAEHMDVLAKNPRLECYDCEQHIKKAMKEVKQKASAGEEPIQAMEEIEHEMKDVNGTFTDHLIANTLIPSETGERGKEKTDDNQAFRDHLTESTLAPSAKDEPERSEPEAEAHTPVNAASAKRAETEPGVKQSVLDSTPTLQNGDQDHATSGGEIVAAIPKSFNGVSGVSAAIDPDTKQPDVDKTANMQNNDQHLVFKMWRARSATKGASFEKRENEC